MSSHSGYLHLDERTDILQAKKVLGDHLCLLGNLKPSLFTLGTPAEVEREVKTIIDDCAAVGPYARRGVRLYARWALCA